MPVTTTLNYPKLPQIVTKLPGPKAKEIVDRDHNSFRLPTRATIRWWPAAGRGAMVEDVDGNTFLDFAAGIAVVATGHCHPDVVAAIQKQAARLIHISCTDFYYEGMVELAEKLAAIAPGKEKKKVYFGNSGTEAIEAAMKLARYHTAPRQIHLVLWLLSWTHDGLAFAHREQSDSAQRLWIARPGRVPCALSESYRGLGRHHAPNTRPTMRWRISRTNLFQSVVDPHDVAGIVIEPIQGEGGYVPAPENFLAGLQQLCRQHGILLIVDEVQSGMGRTGKWWACEHSGIEPDILCIAKGIASGMPLSAMIARESVMDWEPRRARFDFRRQSGVASPRRLSLSD